MSHWKQFKTKACSVSLASDTKETVLREIVANLVAAGALPRDSDARALAALLEREALASTGVGMGVAIPHVRLAGLEATAASLSVHKVGVEWAAVDAAPVHVVFAILRPDRPGDRHDPELHLELMKWISRVARTADFRSFALQATSRTQLVDLLKEMAAV